MQEELNALESDLGISIVAVNESNYGTPTNYALTGEKGSLAVLQDDDQVDAWAQWEVVFRDVVILNECGEKMASYNLTVNSLQIEENYTALKDMIIGFAERE